MAKMKKCPTCGHEMGEDGDGSDKETKAEDTGEGLAKAVVDQMKKNSAKGNKGKENC